MMMRPSWILNSFIDFRSVGVSLVGNDCLVSDVLFSDIPDLYHRHPSKHPSPYLFIFVAISQTRHLHHSNANFCQPVVKQVHPDTGISNTTMSILNSSVNVIFERSV